MLQSNASALARGAVRFALLASRTHASNASATHVGLRGQLALNFTLVCWSSLPAADPSFPCTEHQREKKHASTLHAWCQQKSPSSFCEANQKLVLRHPLGTARASSPGTSHFALERMYVEKKLLRCMQQCQKNHKNTHTKKKRFKPCYLSYDVLQKAAFFFFSERAFFFFFSKSSVSRTRKPTTATDVYKTLDEESAPGPHSNSS